MWSEMMHTTAQDAIAASRANGGAPAWCESTPENYAHLRSVARVVFVGGHKSDPVLRYYGRLDPKTGFEWAVRMTRPRKSEATP